MRLLLAITIALGLTACSTEKPDTEIAADEPKQGPRLACHGFTFTPDDLAAPGADEKSDDAAAEARKHTDAAGPLRRLGEINRRVLFGVGTLSYGASGGFGQRGSRLPTVEVVSDGDRYWFVRSGDCIVRPHLDDGQAWASWAVDPSAPADAADANTLHLLVHDSGCASGQSAEGRITEPRVEYTPEHVGIGITVTPLSGAQTCQSSPWARVTVRLREPVGGRPLLDIGHYPPIPPAVCREPVWC